MTNAALFLTFEIQRNYLFGRKNKMSRVCSVCGKGQTTGNNVSHSKRRTRRTFKANVQKVSYVNAEGKTVNDYVCTRCLKTVERA